MRREEKEDICEEKLDEIKNGLILIGELQNEVKSSEEKLTQVQNSITELSNKKIDFDFRIKKDNLTEVSFSISNRMECRQSCQKSTEKSKK